MPVWPTEPRPRRALALATGALVLAAAGGAAAQRSGDAAKIDTADLRNGAVTSAKLADDAVTSRALANGAVRSRRIATNAVTNRALANNSVTSRKIAQGGVGRLDLAIAARTPIVVTRVATVQFPRGVADSVVARCAPGEVLLSGGFGGLPASFAVGGTQAVVVSSRPDPPDDGAPPSAWVVTVNNLSNDAGAISAYAVCAQGG